MSGEKAPRAAAEFAGYGIRVAGIDTWLTLLIGMVAALGAFAPRPFGCCLASPRKLVLIPARLKSDIRRQPPSSWPGAVRATSGRTVPRKVARTMTRGARVKPKALWY